MTPRQQKFVEQYLLTGNARQSAINAGYSAASAETNGPRMLGNAEISAAIDQAKLKAIESTNLTASWVLRRLQEEATIGENTTPASRVKSLELIGRHLSMWNDKLKIEEPAVPNLENLSPKDRDKLLATLRTVFNPSAVASS